MFRNVIKKSNPYISTFLHKISHKNFFHSTNILLKKDFYSKISLTEEILGVSQKSSTDEIKKAYFKLAKEWHPDVNKATNAKEKFAAISE